MHRQLNWSMSVKEIAVNDERSESKNPDQRPSNKVGMEVL